MSSGTRPPRRPTVGSRNPTARPRRIAGQRPGEPVVDEPVAQQPNDQEAVADEPVAGEPVADEAVAHEPVVTSPVSAEPPAEAMPVERQRARGGRLLAGRRTTVVLVAALVLLLGAAAVEGWYLWLRGDPVVSAQRPVVTGEIAQRAAVEAASASTADILSYGYRDFDTQIDRATSKMTDSFGRQFRGTAEDVKADFVKNQTEQQVKVVAASVVQASSEQVRALLFLDQYVTRAGKGTAVTPYRALVTVVHTEHGWLVSDIETK